MTNSKELIERLRDCAQEAGRISQDPLVAPEDRSGFVIFEQAFADAAKEISELREALKPFTLEDAPVYEDSIWCDFRIKAELVRTARAKIEGNKS